MTRRTRNQYNWGALEFDETILTKHFTAPRRAKIQFVVVHHMTVLDKDIQDDDALDACYRIWQTREASAHYGVDNDFVRQFVWDQNAAWATANSHGNHAGISIEHSNMTLDETGTRNDYKVSEKTWKTGAKLAAYLHKVYKLGRPTSKGFGTGGTLRTHQSFYSTACPGPYFKTIWPKYVAEAQRVYDQITKTPTKPPAPAPKTKEVSVLFLPMAGYNDDGAPGVVDWKKNTRGLAALVNKYKPDLVGTTELSNRGQNKMLPAFDAALPSYDRVSGGTDGRFVYRNFAATDHVASGHVTADKSTELGGDDKQAAWSVDLVDGVRIGTIVAHLENEDGPGADEKRVAQMRSLKGKAVKELKAHGVEDEHIIIIADTNSIAMVKNAMIRDGWTAIGPGFYTGWSDVSQLTFDWGFIKGGPKSATVKRINHNFSDHTALLITWTVTV